MEGLQEQYPVFTWLGLLIVDVGVLLAKCVTRTNEHLEIEIFRHNAQDF